MRLYISKDYQQLSAKAASIVASQVTLKPDSVLGLPTGSTPLGMYENLVRMHKEGVVDFSEVITFNLDEYLGLGPDCFQSYRHYMFHNFFDYINIPHGNINILSATEKNAEEVCWEYDQKIVRTGGIDFQILGIGTNGHIGFNEPGYSLKISTHIVCLAEETIEANSRFFSSREEVPRRAVSMGIGTIMQLKKILLLASGKDKAQIIEKTVSGEITTSVPASLLQLHPDVHIVIDEDAARLINS